VTTTSGIWVPGAVVPLNRGLSDVRAAGYAAGFKDAMVRMHRWRGGAHVDDRYADAAKEVRLRAFIAARQSRVPRFPEDARVRLRFSVMGHPRWDASGGMLAAKWLEDGLVDAKVLRSDRHNVSEVAVTVEQTSHVLDHPPGVYVGMEVQR
jgi:hypothetical protein